MEKNPLNNKKVITGGRGMIEEGEGERYDMPTWPSTFQRNFLTHGDEKGGRREMKRATRG